MSAFPFTKTVPFVPTGTLNPAPGCSAVVPTFAPPHSLREAGVAQQRYICFSPPVSQVLRRVHADFHQRFPPEDVAARGTCQSASEISEQLIFGNASAGEKCQIQTALQKNNIFHKNKTNQERFLYRSD